MASFAVQTALFDLETRLHIHLVIAEEDAGRHGYQRSGPVHVTEFRQLTHILHKLQSLPSDAFVHSRGSAAVAAIYLPLVWPLQ